MIGRYLAFLLVIFAGALSWAEAAEKDLGTERGQFLEARRALQRGDRGRFQQLAQGLKSYPLYPYLIYEDLRLRLEGVPPQKQSSNCSEQASAGGGRSGETGAYTAVCEDPEHSLTPDHTRAAKLKTVSQEVREFLESYPDTPPAEMLRTAWLRQLASAADWPTFLAHYAPQDDTVLRCHHLAARIRMNDLEWVLQDAKELWLVGKDQPKECDLAFDYLARSDLMTPELLWERIRLAMAGENPSLARYLSRRLEPTAQGWVSLWLEAHHHPELALRSPALRKDDPIAREILAYGIMRLAKKDAGKAHALWSEIKPQQAFSEPALGEVARTLALAAVAQNHPEAKPWLDAIPPAAVDAEVQRMRLRTAVASLDWRILKRWTQQEAAPEMNGLRWRYWRARALEETGKGQEAMEIYRSLANEADYYGLLAADRLGLAYPLRPEPTLSLPEKEAELFSLPGLIRARELYFAGLRHEARVEWGRLIENLEESQLPVAAAIAHRWGWHDRAILTLGKARALSDLEMRFPMPHQALVQRYAREQGLDPALLYGFIRAESAFWEDARSPAGALGLMQLMPATGRNTAQRLGVSLASPSELLEAEKNVRLGSAYLKDMLLRFQGNVAMAAVAYNAGPHRAEAWRPSRDCQPADRWVEMIPFTETRRYVRNILFYTSVYEWRMGRQVQPLTARLAAIAPKAAIHLSCLSAPPTRYTANYESLSR